MNETNHDTNMTGNADNRSELRTNCGQGNNHDVQVDVAIPFRSRDEAIIALCQKVFGAWPVYVSDCDQPTTAPSEELEIRTCFMGTEFGEIEAVPLFRYRELQRELTETRKDYKCLAELLDGHDATECRSNLLRMKSELDEMTARAISLSMHLPPQTLAGDVQKWRDEALEEMNTLKRELAETKVEAEKWEKLYDQDTEHLASLQKRDNYGPTETLNETAMRLSRELAEARQELNEWKTLQSWGGTPQIVDEFIKGQQSRIHAAQDAEKQRDVLAEALEMIATHNHADGQCDNGYSPRHVAKQALAAVKGGEA